ncbi:hypothetical protein HNY73_011099 [Argiope bruennichi]|uniref:Uncharacterized protein n=1 Tax=Argiope bruennichi TaxID=94029 RepID=A0A8T0F405_ARGBR|nr:hypothetical protein HNY73_011099 [Argiope bruennichi]
MPSYASLSTVCNSLRLLPHVHPKSLSCHTRTSLHLPWPPVPATTLILTCLARLPTLFLYFTSSSPRVACLFRPRPAPLTSSRYSLSITSTPSCLSAHVPFRPSLALEPPYGSPRSLGYYPFRSVVVWLSLSRTSDLVRVLYSPPLQFCSPRLYVVQSSLPPLSPSSLPISQVTFSLSLLSRSRVLASLLLLILSLRLDASSILLLPRLLDSPHPNSSLVSPYIPSTLRRPFRPDHVIPSPPSPSHARHPPTGSAPSPFPPPFMLSRPPPLVLNPSCPRGFSRPRSLGRRRPFFRPSYVLLSPLFPARFHVTLFSILYTRFFASLTLDLESPPVSSVVPPLPPRAGQHLSITATILVRHPTPSQNVPAPTLLSATSPSLSTGTPFDPPVWPSSSMPTCWLLLPSSPFPSPPPPSPRHQCIFTSQRLLHAYLIDPLSSRPLCRLHLGRHPSRGTLSPDSEFPSHSPE